MFIQELLKKREDRELEDGLQEAIKIFDKQKEALMNIKDSEGFKAIMEYLESTEELYETRLDQENSTETFARYKAIKDLKRFIKSRLK